MACTDDGGARRGDRTPFVGAARPGAGALAVGGLVILAAAVLRVVALDAGWFGVDQARDATWAARIASGAGAPRVGPLMRNRIHLGATYYYFWAIPALFTDAPLGAYLFAAIGGVLAVAASGLFAARVAGPVAGLVAAAWLAVHPMAVIDSRVAWSPAVLPLCSAVILLLARAFLLRPTIVRACALAAAVGFAVQLHLAAAPLAALALGAFVARSRSLGRAGWWAACGVGFAALLPMIFAAAVPLPPAPADAVIAQPFLNRLGDYAFLVSRWMAGLTPRPALLSTPISTAIPLLVFATLLPVAAWFLLLGERRVRERPALVLALAAFAATTVAPLALPTTLWAYYLDAALAPAAILVGVLVATPRRSRVRLAALVAGLLVIHLGIVSWWIALAARRGYVATNLDYLRVGGPRSSRPVERDPVLATGLREEIAHAIVDALGPGWTPVREDLHGPSLDTFDTANGFFILRASASAGPGAGAAPGRNALLVPPGRVPLSWTSAMGEERDLGPIRLVAYAPRLRAAAAWVEGCGEAPLPLPRPATFDPLDYGNGEPRRTAWPCSPATVVVPFPEAPPGTATRVFARMRGPGRAQVVGVSPAGESSRSGVEGIGEVTLLPPGAGELRVRVTSLGPADLDLGELHGRLPGIDPTSGRLLDDGAVSPAQAAVAPPRPPG